MQEDVYCTAVLEVADLKQHPMVAWSGLQQHVTDNAIDQ